MGAKIITLVLGVTVLTGVPTERAAPLDDERQQAVTDYVAGEIESLGVPGAAVVVVDGGGIVFSAAFGSARGEEPVTVDTPFHIASLSKGLTALAAMQLVESGHLQLSASLGGLIPDLVPANSEAAAITVKDLLGHTSGWSEKDGLVNRVAPDYATQSIAGNATRIVTSPLDHHVGEFEYSNANYDLLGYLIERISGDDFAAYMSDHVFGPLEMSHSHASESDAVADGVAQGHYPFFGAVRPHEMVFVPGSLPSSYLTASAEDLGHYVVAHLNDGRYRDEEVLSAEGMATVHRPLVHPNPWDGYAMGLWVYPLWSVGALVTDGARTTYQAPVMLEHAGDSASFASSLLILPEEDLGVVVLFNVNDESVPSLYHQTHLGIATLLLGRDPSPAVPYEGLVERYAKVLALAALGLFVFKAAWSGYRLSRKGSQPPSPSPASAILRVALPLLVDVILVAGVWWVFLSEADTPLALLRRSVPDLFLAVVTATVVGLGWAAVRSVLLMRSLRSATG